MIIVKFNVYVSPFKSDETVSFGNPLHYALSALSIIWNNCKIRMVIQIWMSPSRKKEHVFLEDKKCHRFIFVEEQGRWKSTYLLPDK